VLCFLSHVQEEEEEVWGLTPAGASCRGHKDSDANEEEEGSCWSSSSINYQPDTPSADTASLSEAAVAAVQGRMQELAIERD